MMEKNVIQYSDREVVKYTVPMDLGPDRSETILPCEHFVNAQLDIITQPPSKAVYSRVLKPFPRVAVTGLREPFEGELYVQASLIHEGKDVELLLGPIENQFALVNADGIAVFKKLKIASGRILCQLKFQIVRFIGSRMSDPIGSPAVSRDIEVFTHTD